MQGRLSTTPRKVCGKCTNLKKSEYKFQNAEPHSLKSKSSTTLSALSILTVCCTKSVVHVSTY